MGAGDYLTKLDESLSALGSQWNGYSTGIATAFVVMLTYSVMSRVEPEIHPMLLARQAQGSAVRQEGQSPIYRANSAPHGYPLNSGLNVKTPGASKWAAGRDGDLRDIWRNAISGDAGAILTVLGREKVLDHKLSEITRQINLVGQHIASQGGKKVAIYLPNSVELLAALFACSFHGLTAVLIPFNVSDAELVSMLRRSEADAVVTATGSFPFDSVVKSYPGLRQLIWVVDEGSKHMDWNEVPQGTGSRVNVSTWQDILNDNPVAAGLELPAAEGQSPAKEVIMFTKKGGDLEEMVSFTQGNLVSAVSAQLTAVPSKYKLSQADLFLPASSLVSPFTLVMTLAALHANASVALNSVAGATPDLELATAGVAPTVIVTEPEAILKSHEQVNGKLTSYIAKASHYVQTRSLVQNGAMPAASFLASYNDSIRPVFGTTPGKLRLLYVADTVGTQSSRLSEAALSNLRVFTGSRVIHALAAPQVAGAVAQTQFHDYRVQGDGSGTHYGAPLSSVEVYLKDSGSHKITDTDYTGEVVVRGPAVSGGEASIGIIGNIRQDNTLGRV
ncbi:uncharacterized protein B0I36DRAFT_287688 [Microdochium trichocladiopsis]|uniref:AMP-dependent synthetase/ligase domain-containing protein n=1 Tax=Microdochium trichocladiopsis TaxID=1682393 RepID=A0A9P9BS25_9PEZI|nr:uncharacterized protein B0I36DRAFT_287688 [Microdochium trichocladiopsis]KAH7033415.1 hypothetical protein B0I36DRAFT_287688 [Microdochium trichocladiopsis]